MNNPCNVKKKNKKTNMHDMGTYGYGHDHQPL